MSGRIFRSIIAVTVFALIASACAFFAISYIGYGQIAENEIKRAAQFAADGVEACGTDYLRGLKKSDMRTTLISSGGDVIFDSMNDRFNGEDNLENTAENYLSEKEIISAFESGYGYARRISPTNLEDTVYYAIRLSDGNVLRVEDSVKSVGLFVLSTLGQAVIILFLVLVIAGIIASKLASSIVRPVIDIDLSHPEKLEQYKEFEPVSKRLKEQNNLIHKKIEELSLRQTEFSAITDNMSEGMLVIGNGAEILSYNKSAEEMLGLSDKMPKNIVSVNTVPGLQSAVADALSGKKSLVTVRSEDKYYSMMINPVIHEKCVEGAVAIILDETEKEQREALRREFTSNVSHELKTPLTSISGFAEIIMGGLADGDEKRFAGNIYREAQRLITLVGDIIKLNRLDGGEITFDEIPPNLYEICETVSERLANVADNADVALSVCGERGAKACVNGNAHILEEIIYNLADNGIKYNNPGGKVELCVSYLADSGKVSVCCRDNGIGIPESQKERVFERFFRVDKSRSKSIGGTGLGLSIVKHGATCHNAEIVLSSRENEGTSVTLTFPPLKKK